MGFKLKSGNTSSFKLMGGSEKSPAKDMKTGKYSHSFESPAKAKKLFGEATTEGKESPAKQYENPSDRKRETPGQYWYKINGKPVTKTEYIKYQNKPGGDEPGKQTNDPSVSLAKISANKRTNTINKN